MIDNRDLSELERDRGYRIKRLAILVLLWSFTATVTTGLLTGHNFLEPLFTKIWPAPPPLSSGNNLEPIHVAADGSTIESYVSPNGTKCAVETTARNSPDGFRQVGTACLIKGKWEWFSPNDTRELLEATGVK